MNCEAFLKSKVPGLRGSGTRWEGKKESREFPDGGRGLSEVFIQVGDLVLVHLSAINAFFFASRSWIDTCKNGM